jgi:hypothetical protein
MNSLWTGNEERKEGMMSESRGNHKDSRQKTRTRRQEEQEESLCHFSFWSNFQTHLCHFSSLEIIRFILCKRFTNYCHCICVSLKHIPVLFTCQETQLNRRRNNLVSVSSRGCIDQFQVFFAEFCWIFSTCSKVKKVNL